MIVWTALLNQINPSNSNNVASTINLLTSKLMGIEIDMIDWNFQLLVNMLHDDIPNDFPGSHLL